MGMAIPFLIADRCARPQSQETSGASYIEIAIKRLPGLWEDVQSPGRAQCECSLGSMSPDAGLTHLALTASSYVHISSAHDRKSPVLSASCSPVPADADALSLLLHSALGRRCGLPPGDGGGEYREPPEPAGRRVGEREQLDGALRHERAAAVADPCAGRAPVTDARRDEVIAPRLSF